jgi:CBS domain-containing protein
MKGPVVTIGPAVTLREAACALRNADIGTVVVMEGSDLVGILSERDVVFALAEDADADEVWVGDVMSDDPRYVTIGEDVASAVDVMLAAGIRHLPVVDEGELVGIVSIRDLSKALRP